MTASNARTAADALVSALAAGTLTHDEFIATAKYLHGTDITPTIATPTIATPTVSKRNQNRKAKAKTASESAYIAELRAAARNTTPTMPAKRGPGRPKGSRNKPKAPATVATIDTAPVVKVNNDDKVAAWMLRAATNSQIRRINACEDALGFAPTTREMFDADIDGDAVFTGLDARNEYNSLVADMKSANVSY